VAACLFADRSQYHRLELYSLVGTVFTLQSYLPFDCTIRSAAPFSRALSDHTDFEAKVFPPASPTSFAESQRKKDLVLCTTDSGELVVVDWDAGRNAIPASGIPAIKPGLRVVQTIRQARPGKDVCSLGRFIRVSQEYPPPSPKSPAGRSGWFSRPLLTIFLVVSGWLSALGRICLIYGIWRRGCVHNSITNKFFSPMEASRLLSPRFSVRRVCG